MNNYAIYITKSSQDMMTLLLMVDVSQIEKEEALTSVKHHLYWEGDNREEFDSVLDGLLTMLEVSNAPDLDIDSQ